MERSTTFLLKAAIIVLGIFVLCMSIFVLPVGIREDETGLITPVFIGVYFSGIPFFYALYQALLLLNLVDTNKAFSEKAVRMLGNLRAAAFTIAGLYALGSPYLYYLAELEDAPGVLALDLMVVFISMVVGLLVSVIRRILENAIAIKKENDLTV